MYEGGEVLRQMYGSFLAVCLPIMSAYLSTKQSINLYVYIYNMYIIYIMYIYICVQLCILIVYI